MKDLSTRRQKDRLNILSTSSTPARSGCILGSMLKRFSRIFSARDVSVATQEFVF